MGRGGSDTEQNRPRERERERERKGGKGGGGAGREREIAGQTRFPLDGLAAENAPLLGK